MKLNALRPATFLGTLSVSLLSTTHAGAAEPLSFAEPTRIEGLEMEELEGTEFADFNGDGKADLLGGNYGGNLIYRENIGSLEAPEFANAVRLQRDGEDIKLKHW